jgi:hypothetical protein
VHHGLIADLPFRGRGSGGGGLAVALVAVSIAVAGCTPGRTGGLDASTCDSGDRALGEECACDGECAMGRCAHNRLLEPEGFSYCTTDCTSSSFCPTGYECTEGAASEGNPFCQRCASIEPGVVQLLEPCLCNADCSQELGPTECNEGVCRIPSCDLGDATTCPDSFGCESAPGFATYCAECVDPAGTPGLEGESCGCSRECAKGLLCRTGACRSACQDDEQCGARSCTHRVGETPTCQDPILDCVADGSVQPGEPCDCNADCTSAFCLLGSFGDVTIDRCAATCTPGLSDCPGATRCCGADYMLDPTCLPEDVIEALGGSVQCDP